MDLEIANFETTNERLKRQRYVIWEDIDRRLEGIAQLRHLDKDEVQKAFIKWCSCTTYSLEEAVELCTNLLVEGRPMPWEQTNQK